MFNYLDDLKLCFYNIEFLFLQCIDIDCLRKKQKQTKTYCFLKISLYYILRRVLFDTVYSCKMNNEVPSYLGLMWKCTYSNTFLCANSIPADPAGGYCYWNSTKTCKSIVSAMRDFGVRLSNAWSTYLFEELNSGN